MNGWVRAGSADQFDDAHIASLAAALGRSLTRE